MRSAVVAVSAAAERRMWRKALMSEFEVAR
jgi:hypothetical protein